MKTNQISLIKFHLKSKTNINLLTNTLEHMRWKINFLIKFIVNSSLEKKDISFFIKNVELFIFIKGLSLVKCNKRS